MPALLVDDAGLLLAGLANLAANLGAAVRLLGDPAELATVDASVELSALEHEVGAAHLTDLRRFHRPRRRPSHPPAPARLHRCPGLTSTKAQVHLDGVNLHDAPPPAPATGSPPDVTTTPSLTDAAAGGAKSIQGQEAIAR